MHNAGAEIELDFYRTIQRLDATAPETRIAISFSRVFAEFAIRYLTARAAQTHDAAPFLASLGKPALEAYLAGADSQFPERFMESTVRLRWPVEIAQALAGIAAWLAALYDPGRPHLTSFQIWLDSAYGDTVHIYGHPAASAPPHGLRLIPEFPLREWLQSTHSRPSALLAHYDTHGLSMMALSLRCLLGYGLEHVDCAMSFEWTGDIGKLWKRAVAKTLADAQSYATLVMVDCPIHSRHPDYTLKAIRRLNNPAEQRLVIVDHHPDTFWLAPQIIEEAGVTLVLTDILSCGLTSTWDPVELDLMSVGAMGDKVPEMLLAHDASRYRELAATAEQFQRWCLHFSPTPPAFKEAGQYPLRPLWEALAAGVACSPATSEAALGLLPPQPEVPSPSAGEAGAVAVVTDRLAVAGRAWYQILETLMQAQQVPYALAVRLLNGTRANMLLLTNWENTAVPPIRSFIPDEYQGACLGHPTAVWVDLDKRDAIEFLGTVIDSVNRYMDRHADVEAILELVRKNILDAEPVTEESPAQAGDDSYHE